MIRNCGASVALAFACVCLMVAPGCGDDGPTLVDVTGTVTQNNAPLEGAAVMFMPDPSSPDARPAEDTTGPDGNYKLRTGTRFGAVPGKYRVVITPAPPASTMAKVDPAFADDPFMAGLSAGVNPTKSKGKSAQPAEFTEDREITAEGSQVHDFDVKIKASDS